MFRVGDKVVAKNNSPYNITANGWVWICDKNKRWDYLGFGIKNRPIHRWS